MRASIGDDGLTVTDLPPYIILLRHGEVGTKACLYAKIWFKGAQYYAGLVL
jgi:hypothetical protein